MKSNVETVTVEDVSAAKHRANMQMLLAETAAAAFQRPGKGVNLQFLRWVVTLTFIGSTFAIAVWGLLADLDDFLPFQQDASFFRGGSRTTSLQVQDPECAGRRVYMYPLPPQFNEEPLERFCSKKYSFMGLCDSFINGGFGMRMNNSLEPAGAWYKTDQFGLEPIVHEKFKHYRCLTDNPDMADLLYLPYYVGLDCSATLFSNSMQVRDFLVERFFGWLMAQPTWTRSQGNKHFLVLGRIIWDFSRPIDINGWGNSLLATRELQNVTKVTIERNPHSKDRRQMAIPYPTSFHPTSDRDIERWQKTVVESKREKLASFAGAPRNTTKWPEMRIRDILFEQCESSDLCETLRCDKVNCPKHPHVATNTFLNSHFCFQPPGDSSTRKATFDCLVAGGIPVFFSQDSAYTQYRWHLPANESSYSVFIDEKEVMETKMNVVDILAKIPSSQIEEMHRFISKEIIPRIVYDKPGAGRSRDSKVKDAFDIALEHFFNPSFQTYWSPLDVAEATANSGSPTPLPTAHP